MHINIHVFFILKRGLSSLIGLSNLVMMNIKQNATMNARLRTIESHLATLVNSSEARPKIPASFASDFPLDSKEAYETWVETLESDPIKREHLVSQMLFTRKKCLWIHCIM